MSPVNADALWLCCWAINIHVERTDKEIEVQIQGMLIHNPEPPGILQNMLLVSLILTSYTPQNQGRVVWHIGVLLRGLQLPEVWGEKILVESIPLRAVKKDVIASVGCWIPCVAFYVQGASGKPEEPHPVLPPHGRQELKWML